MVVERISDTMHRITCVDNRVITLIGTAHVSQESVEEVSRTIEELSADRVCVELDIGRYQSKTSAQGWENLNIKTVLKENKGFLLLANMALSSYQKKLGTQIGVSPGDEIIKAAQLAEQKQIPLSFCDREIQVTFKRAWRMSNGWNKLKLISTLLAAVFSNEQISEEEIEKLKESNVLQSMLDEMAKELPMIKRVLIDERDQYLATSIYNAQGSNVVAVVGAGHVPGLIAHMKKLEAQQVSSDLSSITEVPNPSRIGKALPWTILVLFIALIVSGFIRAGWSHGLQMFGYWIVINGSLAGLAALLSLAHPLTIIASIIASPITSLNPTIGVGMVAGIIEATVKKPRVKDFEHISDDILRFKGWFSNRLIHILLIFMTTSIFGAIGTFIAFPVLIGKLAGA